MKVQIANYSKFIFSYLSSILIWNAKLLWRVPIWRYLVDLFSLRCIMRMLTLEEAWKKSQSCSSVWIFRTRWGAHRILPKGSRVNSLQHPKEGQYFNKTSHLFRERMGQHKRSVNHFLALLNQPLHLGFIFLYLTTPRNIWKLLMLRKSK